MTDALVCLHGFTGTPRAFSALGVPTLSCPFLAGHGPDPDLSSADFGQEIARLHRVLTQTSSGPFRLLAYSMGARLGLGLLERDPALFSEAILIGVNPGLTSDEAREERLGWEARWIDVLEQDGLAVFEHKWQKQPLFASQRSLPPRSQDALRSERLSHTAAGLVHALQVLGLGSMPNYWPALSRIETPVTLVHGALDEKFAKITRAMIDSNPQFRAVSIPRVGHNPLLEAPEAISALLHHLP